tara:strand:+ start:373 stop:528 length:156 start_codon:yes stop_codon:yes gene_type:complete
MKAFPTIKITIKENRLMVAPYPHWTKVNLCQEYKLRVYVAVPGPPEVKTKT